MQDLELRQKVAIACGWRNIKQEDRWIYPVMVGENLSYPSTLIPKYELSIDAIVKEFIRKDWFFEAAWMPAFQKFRVIDIDTHEFLEPSLPIALCKLYLAICEDRENAV
jgi:hypothetical protein